MVEDNYETQHFKKKICSRESNYKKCRVSVTNSNVDPAARRQKVMRLSMAQQPQKIGTRCNSNPPASSLGGDTWNFEPLDTSEAP